MEEAANTNPEEEVEEAANANPKEEVEQTGNANSKEEDQVISSEPAKTGFNKETKQNTSKKSGKGKREKMTDKKERKENEGETRLHKVQSGRVKKERPKRDSLKPKNCL